jgi:radical SAM protein with 4Fe4S-binding SPASM domain
MAAVPHPEQFLDLDDFERRLDFLERSGIREARLIGGEPTLHPRFPELVALALDRLDRVLVFTNGCIPDRSMKALLDLDPDRCTVLVNMTAYEGDGISSSVYQRRSRTLSSLGARALVGITIVRPVVDYDWLPPLMQDAGCRPAVRVGLGQPVLGGSNDFLHPKQYVRAGVGIVRLASVAANRGIRVELDCGFVPCMFSAEELARLKLLGADVGWHCGPVCDIDIDGRMIHCFPLAAMPGVEAIAANLGATRVRRVLAEQLDRYRGVGIYRECSNCRFHTSGECTGGCRGAALSRLHRSEFRVTVPAVRHSTIHPIRSTGESDDQTERTTPNGQA